MHKNIASDKPKELPPLPVYHHNVPAPTPLKIVTIPAINGEAQSKSPVTPTLTLPRSPHSTEHGSHVLPTGNVNRANPLVELIESETQYVEDLEQVVEIASVWSHCPKPPELEVMLVNIGIIYAANKRFCNRLVKIGPNPSSPKELGDALMQWIDDFVPKYTRYCEEFVRGLDMADQVIDNSQLQDRLAMLSARKIQEVTLDYLFNIPLDRLKYYKKLYKRLYQSSEPGRSDHQLLKNANDRLDEVLLLAHQAREKQPAYPQASPRLVGVAHAPKPQKPPAVHGNMIDLDRPLPKAPLSDSPQIRKEEGRGGEMDPVEDLENRINCSYVRDLFTLQPKKCKLQLRTSNARSRFIVKRGDFHIMLAGKHEPATGLPVQHRGHVILLNDLVLFCRHMSEDELREHRGCDLFLLYPPLTIRHIQIAPVTSEDGSLFELVVMKQERIILRAPSRDIRDHWLEEAGRRGLIPDANGITPLQRSISNGHAQGGHVQGRHPARDYIPHTAMGQDMRNKAPPSLKLSQHDNTDLDPRGRSPLPVSPGLRVPTPGSRSPSPGGNLRPELPLSPIQGNGGTGLASPTVRFATSQKSSPSSSPAASPIPSPRTSPSSPNFPGSSQAGYLRPDISSDRVQIRNDRSVSVASSASSTSTTQETIFRSESCDVFRHHEGTWTLMQEECTVEIRMTANNRACLAIVLEERRQQQPQLLLNVWISPTLHLKPGSLETIVEMSCEIGGRTERYRFEFDMSRDVDALLGMLQRVRTEKSVMDSTQTLSRFASLAVEDGNGAPTAPLTLIPVMQSKCKVLLQNEYSSWINLGSGLIQLSTQMPVQKSHIRLELDKNKTCLLNAVVPPEWVERQAAKRLTIMVQNERGLSTVYMVQVRDDGTANAIVEHMKKR
ncbi:uncharacterized protein VTP21DRAFT_6518 [Calcarisporiella thermophila]|uniref:uncharacterized protein n=1 Tax=Calcarisporiella thermophila TaxID=911321 RepID=UPI0037427169